MITLLKKLVLCKINIVNSLQPLILPATTLAIRIWIANIFWKSGVTKLNSWDSTLFLFEHEYQVPLLPHDIAAYLGTFGELVFPALLFIGLFARFSAVGLLFMTAVIEFTYTHNVDHILWALLLIHIVVMGAGAFSIDRLLWNKFSSADPKECAAGCKVMKFIYLIVTAGLVLIAAHEIIALLSDGVEPLVPAWNKFWGI